MRWMGNNMGMVLEHSLVIDDKACIYHVSHTKVSWSVSKSPEENNGLEVFTRSGATRSRDTILHGASVDHASQRI